MICYELKKTYNALEVSEMLMFAHGMVEALETVFLEAMETANINSGKQRHLSLLLDAVEIVIQKTQDDIKGCADDLERFHHDGRVLREVV